LFFFFQADDGIRDFHVTGVQTCALPIWDQSAALTLRFSRIAELHGGKVLLVALLAGLLSAFGISRLEVENRFIDYFHEDSEIHQGMKVIDQNLGGTVTLDIILDADPAWLASTQPVEDDPFADPDEEFEGDPFADEEDPFADEDSEKAPESYWFTLNGLDEIRKLHHYLES